MNELFGSTSPITLAQECARALLIFVYGLLLLRIVGRRLFAQWTALDIVVSIIIGSSLSRAMTGNAALWGTLAATTLLLAVHWLLSHAVARSPPLSRLLEGEPVPLGRDGAFDEAALRRHAVSAADLDQALHEAGLHQPADARLVVLEPNGRITVLKREP